MQHPGYQMPLTHPHPSSPILTHPQRIGPTLPSSLHDMNFCPRHGRQGGGPWTPSPSFNPVSRAPLLTFFCDLSPWGTQ